MRKLLILSQQNLILANELEAKLLQFLLLLLHILQLIKQISVVLGARVRFLFPFPTFLPVGNERLTLDNSFLPADILKLLRVVPGEEVVLIGVITEYSIHCIPDLIEIVHVELPDEGVIVAVLEVLGEDVSGEGVQI